MSKHVVLLSALICLLAGFTGAALGAQNVANTTQKGSLLIFPRVDIREVSPGVQMDTIIRISNDYPAAVTVSCFWVSYEWDKTGFNFILPPNDTVWFTAREGLASRRIFNEVAPFPPPFQINPYTGKLKRATGELKCFAVDPDFGAPISFNHLYGTVEIIENENFMYAYPSWNFIARGVSLGQPVGQPGKLVLSGKNGEYDACPAYLTTEYQPLVAGADGSPGSRLCMVPCNQDLRQDGGRVFTKALFEIFDQNGTKVGNAWKCVMPPFDEFLQEITPAVDPWTGLKIAAYGGENFNVHGMDPELDNARLRVSAVKSTACETDHYYDFWRDTPPYWTAPSGIPGLASAYYAVIGIGPLNSSRNSAFLGVIVKHRPVSGMYAKNPVGAGAYAGGSILYDAPRVSLE